MTQTILDYLNVTSDDFLLRQIVTILIIVRAKWLHCLRVCFLRLVSASVLLGPEHTGHFVQPHVAATCRPSVLGSATMRGHMWLNKVASVLGPLVFVGGAFEQKNIYAIVTTFNIKF